MYIVAKRHSFSAPRGILLPGDEVTERDFPDKKAFLKRVQKGSIVAGKSKDQLAKEEAEAKIAAGNKAAKAEAARRTKELEDAALEVRTAEAALENANKALKAAQDAAVAAKEKTMRSLKRRSRGLRPPSVAPRMP
jgi:predicted ribosome quality control (RQC) complex YloA/Tae2 family protein